MLALVAASGCFTCVVSASVWLVHGDGVQSRTGLQSASHTRLVRAAVRWLAPSRPAGVPLEEAGWCGQLLIGCPPIRRRRILLRVPRGGGMAGSPMVGDAFVEVVEIVPHDAAHDVGPFEFDQLVADLLVG